VRAVDAGARPETILATNTSALSVTAIAGAATRPGRVLGLHFFNPVPRMALVEVVVTEWTEPMVARRAELHVAGWGKTTVRCADTPGFIVNRVNRPYTLEALRILEAGLADVEQLDGAARSNGYPMGPFELMDLIGLDINLAAASGLYAAFNREPRFRPSPIQERLVAVGMLGRKTGLGFYRYDADGRALGVSPDVAGAVRSTSRPGDAGPRAEDLVERLTLGIVNEAYHALGEAVATPADIDLALRLGAGHPLGPFERVAALGGPRIAAELLTRMADAYGERFRPAPALQAAEAAG
jgi:3-hydroxybutyryl-CoA dehydrogenase